METPESLEALVLDTLKREHAGKPTTLALLQEHHTLETIQRIVNDEFVHLPEIDAISQRIDDARAAALAAGEDPAAAENRMFEEQANSADVVSDDLVLTDERLENLVYRVVARVYDEARIPR